MHQISPKNDTLSSLAGFLISDSDISTNEGQKEIFERYNGISIASLPPEVLRAVFAGAKLGDLQTQVSKAAAKACLDYKQIKVAFLDTFESKATKKLYEIALERFENYCKEKEISPLAFKISDAMDFICYLKTSAAKDGQGLAANSVRSFLAACSSFFSFVRLKSDGAIELNPFERLKGKGGKPKRRLSKPAVYPTKKDVETYVEFFLSCGKEKEALIVTMMANDGFRTGAFESMVISDKGRATFTSKGKDYTARNLSKATIEALNGKRGRIFKGYGESKINMARALRGEEIDAQTAAKDCSKKIGNEIMSAGKKLLEMRMISEMFSPHDFRHYFACELYKATKDVRKVQIALGHSNISITDTYLRGLGVLTDD